MITKWDRIVPPTVLFIVTLITASVFGSYGVDPYHDGNIFKPAKDVSEGMMLYRDTWSQYGPLSTLLMAAAIKVFGAKLIVIHMLTAFFYSFIAVMLWLITSRSIPSDVAVVPVLAWLGVAGYIEGEFMPWCNIYANFFTLAALYCFQSTYADYGREGAFNLFAAGLLAALANLSRNPAGILGLVAMLLFVFGHRLDLTPERLRRAFGDALWMLAGFALPMIAFFSWLVANDAIRDWKIQSIQFPAVIAKDRFDLSDPVWMLNHLFPFRELGFYQSGSYLYGLLPVTCLVMLGLLGGRLFVKRELCVEERSALALVLVALSSWSQYIPFPDSEYHAYWGAAPMFSVAAILFFWASKTLADRLAANKSRPIISYFLFGVAMLALTGNDIRETLQSGWRKLRSSDWVTMSSPLTVQGMKVYQGQADTMRRLDETIRGYLAKHPGRPVINVHKDALYVTFTPNARNFHPLYIDWSMFDAQEGLLTGVNFPQVIYPDYWGALVEYVQRNKPLIIGREGLNLPGYTVLTTIPGDNSMGTWPLMDIVVLVPLKARDSE